MFYRVGSRRLWLGLGGIRLALYTEEGGDMSDGREERDERRKRREQESRENREDWINRDNLEELKPERTDS